MIMRHVISVILQNEVGALTRMTGLFSTRGYNIESLNVAAMDDKNLSRVTLVVKGTDKAIAQLNSQLSKLVDVISINDMTLGDYFERELLIVKVKLNTGADKKILPIINEYKGEIIDDSIDSFTIQLTDNVKNIDNFLSRIINLGDLHAVARSGSVSVTKGQITLSSYANQNLSS